MDTRYKRLWTFAGFEKDVTTTANPDGSVTVTVNRVEFVGEGEPDAIVTISATCKTEEAAKESIDMALFEVEDEAMRKHNCW